MTKRLGLVAACQLLPAAPMCADDDAEPAYPVVGVNSLAAP
jgi:hypothetical protein